MQALMWNIFPMPPLCHMTRMMRRIQVYLSLNISAMIMQLIVKSCCVLLKYDYHPLSICNVINQVRMMMRILRKAGCTTCRITLMTVKI